MVRAAERPVPLKMMPTNRFGTWEPADLPSLEACVAFEAERVCAPKPWMKFAIAQLASARLVVKRDSVHILCRYLHTDRDVMLLDGEWHPCILMPSQTSLGTHWYRCEHVDTESVTIAFAYEDKRRPESHWILSLEPSTGQLKLQILWCDGEKCEMMLTRRHMGVAVEEDFSLGPVPTTVRHAGAVLHLETLPERYALGAPDMSLSVTCFGARADILGRRSGSNSGDSRGSRSPRLGSSWGDGNEGTEGDRRPGARRAFIKKFFRGHAL
mmetsp:Transcript_173263/g.555722  ORF Transcript_173263/g.555722 Transcript_173263/m.555722 type:complete len:269 (-) Transcript_173263:157-963(-)